MASQTDWVAQLYHDERSFIRRTLWRMGVARDAVDDLVHDVFTVVYRRRDSFDARRPARPWLWTVCSYVARHHRRSEARCAAHVPYDDGVDGAARSLPMPTVTEPLLVRALAALPERDRTVLMLCDVAGFSATEVGEELGLSVAAVCSRRRRARDALRELMLRKTPRRSGRRSLLLLLLPARERRVASFATKAAVWGAFATIVILTAARELPASHLPRRVPKAGTAGPPPAEACVTPSVYALESARSERTLTHERGSEVVVTSSVTQRVVHGGVRNRGIHEETRWIVRARAALRRSEAAQALTLLDGHRRRFENGMLAEEREHLRILALRASGRCEEARRATSAFHRAFPASNLGRGRVGEADVRCQVPRESPSHS